MKTGAIVRIVLYSLLFLMLLGILITGIVLVKLASWNPSGDLNVAERSVSAEEYSKLDIEWTAGSINIQIGGSDKIIIREYKDSNNPYALITEHSQDTLKVRYADGVSINFGNLASKDLTIIVPKNWPCKELTINGAALEIDINDLTVDCIDLDGAATELNFTGSFGKLECDGAASELNIMCTNSPEQVSIDGAACELNLTLPVDCGYRVETDGLAIEFKSNCDYRIYDDKYFYGNANCHIDISGLGCQIKVDEAH
jgi:hypothetical protein